MINKPITLSIALTYSQAVALIKQLEYKLDKLQDKKYNRDAEVKAEINAFQKWKAEKKNV